MLLSMKIISTLILSFLSLIGCASKQAVNTSAEHGVPFSYAGRYLIKIPVTLNETHPTYFIFDTGIGVNLLSKSLCENFGCTIQSSHTGQRMSGQKITVPMSQINSLTFAGQKIESIPTGVWEMKGFLPPDEDCKNVEGFLSLGFFRKIPFTMDYKKKLFFIETAESLKVRKSKGFVIPITIDEDGPAVTIFMPLKLSDGSTIKVEIDLGGDILTLNRKLMPTVGADPKAKGVLIEKQKDETGHPYVRYYTGIKGPIAPAAAPNLQQSNLKVMFQDIIYDGLIANDFMKRFTVTYDLANSEIILEP